MTWTARVTAALGTIERSRPLGGSLWQVTVDGRALVVKVGTGVADPWRPLVGERALGGRRPALAQDDILHTHSHPIIVEE
ncbi:MAG TPA: hypothetical protein VHW93_09690 [Acidimicrobiales bacterium]|nr:hypothetical protein [Acidimicrobiales bacterium]